MSDSSTRYEAALDTAGPVGAFALRAMGSPDAPVHRLDITLGRRSVDLLPAIQGLLAEHGIAVAAIDRWTVGMGPGSFTGIRVGASLVLGLTAGRRDAWVRGLPSGIAVAAQLSLQPGQTYAVLNDGRRHQAIVSRYIVAPDGAIQASGESEPLGIDELAAETADIFAIRAQDAAADACRDALGDRLTSLDSFDAAGLLNPPGHPWDGPPPALDPVYVRPAVHVRPINSPRVTA